MQSSFDDQFYWEKTFWKMPCQIKKYPMRLQWHFDTAATNWERCCQLVVMSTRMLQCKGINVFLSAKSYSLAASRCAPPNAITSCFCTRPCFHQPNKRHISCAYNITCIIFFSDFNIFFSPQLWPSSGIALLCLGTALFRCCVVFVLGAANHTVWFDSGLFSSELNKFPAIDGYCVLCIGIYAHWQSPHLAHIFAGASLGIPRTK